MYRVYLNESSMKKWNIYKNNLKQMHENNNQSTLKTQNPFLGKTYRDILSEICNALQFVIIV
jgi:hypothetical protein